MATKKAASTKKATVKKPAAAKTTVRTIRADEKSTSHSDVFAANTTKRNTVKLPKNLVNRKISKKNRK